MAAIDFPSAPTVGQEYPFGDFTYVWDGVKWTTKVIIGSTEGSDARYVNITGDTMTGLLTIKTDAALSDGISFRDTTDNTLLMNMSTYQNGKAVIYFNKEHPGTSEGLQFRTLNLEGNGVDDVFRIKALGEIYADGNNRIYHEGFKPTAAEVGAVPREEHDSIIAALIARIEALEAQVNPAS